MTQNNLGGALFRLGERLGGEEGNRRLAEAVAAYEAALRVYTEKDMPAQWATTQNNLGNALRVLGERLGGEAGAKRLAEAVAAFEAGLRVAIFYFWGEVPEGVPVVDATSLLHNGNLLTGASYNAPLLKWATFWLRIVYEIFVVTALIIWGRLIHCKRSVRPPPGMGKSGN